MRAAFVGSREFVFWPVIEVTIDKLYAEYGEDLTIVSGGARGADKIAELYAKKLGIPTTIFLPDWDRFGKQAGFIRNRQIIQEAEAVWAFFAPGPRSRGTQNSIDLANAARKPVHIYHEGE